MSDLRVLHLDTGRSWRGGQQQVLYLHRGLRGQGVGSHLLCSRGGELARRAEELGLPVSTLPLRGEWDLPSALRVGFAAKRLGATHLHLHSSHAQTLGLLAARLCGLRNVVVTRRVDFVPRRHALNRWKYGAGVSRFIAISRAIAEILRGMGIPEDRLRLVHSGVELSRAAPGSGTAVRRALGIPEGAPLVGNVGHLADHKGQRYLVEAAPRVLEEQPECRFVIVGEGELEADLKGRARALGVEGRVLFTGFREDVPAVLDALDVFVMCSHLEGLGTIVLDALAAGKPVVATRAGGIPEMIEDGTHGLLVPVREPGRLAAGILRLLGDRELAARLGEAGRRRVQETFSADAMVAGNLAVYRELGTDELRSRPLLKGRRSAKGGGGLATPPGARGSPCEPGLPRTR